MSIQGALDGSSPASSGSSHAFALGALDLRHRGVRVPRLQALILLCAHPGLWVSEVLALTIKDISLEERELTVRHGNGGKMKASTNGLGSNKPRRPTVP